jgi:hypothetical protein
VAAPLVHTFTPKQPRDLMRMIDEALRTPVDAAAAAALAASMSWPRVFKTELLHLQRLCR